ncbi:synaptonemal complex central element protein 2-like [Ptychodera flava]|uniref:synaptonemal complex central element protein 2-like n=1 Tax=Ptychodera flava TaxID=63121 RepID=UPI00396A4317
MDTLNKTQENFADEGMPVGEPERPDIIEQSNPSESASLPQTEATSNVDESTSASVTGPVTREALQSAAQSLIEEINSKRKRDTTLLTDFKKNMEVQISNSASMVEQAMYETYEQNGRMMQEKLQLLFATLDRIAKLETELDDFKHALGLLYKDVHLDTCS